jgi:hypothetical protein
MRLCPIDAVNDKIAVECRKVDAILAAIATLVVRARR